MNTQTGWVLISINAKRTHRIHPPDLFEMFIFGGSQMPSTATKITLVLEITEKHSDSWLFGISEHLN